MSHRGAGAKPSRPGTVFRSIVLTCIKPGIDRIGRTLSGRKGAEGRQARATRSERDQTLDSEALAVKPGRLGGK
jgi:hypothetical protein